MKPAEEEYQYTALPDAENFIRILMIQPSEIMENPIECQIYIAPLHSSRYHALSYSWAMEDGDAEPNRTISVEAKPMAVTRNLFEGLRRLRTKSQPLHIWIDAISINQLDIEEKSHQVARMAEIYRNATDVLVWLGEGESEAVDATAFRLLQGLPRLLKEHRKHRWPLNECPLLACIYNVLFDEDFDCGCGSRGRKKRPASLECIEGFATGDCTVLAEWARHIDLFVGRRYWNRRWILQEICSAKDQSWYWGHYSWKVTDACSKHFGYAYYIISIYEHLVDSSPPSPLCPPEIRSAISVQLNEIISKMEHVEKMLTNNVTKQAPDSKGMSLPERLAAAENMQCNDPRDIIFSLIGMCTTPIHADYRLSMQDAFIAAAEALLRDGYLDALLHNLNVTRLTRGLYNVSPQQPSWVPDFREPWRMPLHIRDLDLSEKFTIHPDHSLTLHARFWGAVEPDIDVANYTVSLRHHADDCLQIRLRIERLLDAQSLGRYRRVALKHFGKYPKLWRPDPRYIPLPEVQRYGLYNEDIGLEKMPEMKLLLPGDLLCSVHPEFDWRGIQKMLFLRSVHGEMDVL